MEQINKSEYKGESKGCFAWLCCRKKKEKRHNQSGQYKRRTVDIDIDIGDDENIWADNDNTVGFNSLKSRSDDDRPIINDFNNKDVENILIKDESCHNNEQNSWRYKYDYHSDISKAPRYDNSHNNDFVSSSGYHQGSCHTNAHPTSTNHHGSSHTKDHSSSSYHHGNSHANDHSSSSYHHGNSHANDHSSSSYHHGSSHTNDHSSSNHCTSSNDYGDSGGGGDYGGGDCGGAGSND